MTTGLLAVATAVGLVLFGGCAANDPFDPESLENRQPSVSFFVSPVTEGEDLSPTSYSTRTFHWSGTDPDGWVVEYYVAIDTSAVLDAVWATTTSTDTTITFAPDAEGNADALFMIACLDNRGAYSDTVRQFVPMQNFPPVLDFQSDFDPLSNMQREFRDADGNVIEDGAAASDTLFWNWGPSSFRFLAYDLDGQDTMEPYFRYTLADDEPDSTYDFLDPRADPESSWVRVPYFTTEEAKEFTVYLKSVDPGPARTLSVSVRDTVGTGQVFKYTWEVRAPKSRILYVRDASAPTTKAFYQDYLDDRYGVGQWDHYDFWKGYPDEDFTLLESFRQFEVILWTDTGTASNNITRASSWGDGVLQVYLYPELYGNPSNLDSPGKLFLISRILTGGSSGLSNPFRENILGIKVNALPEAALVMPAGPQALGLLPYLPDMTSVRGSQNGGVGLDLLPDADDQFISEFLYQMEECGECYGTPRRPAIPPDPHVAVRAPLRDTEAIARVVGVSLQLDDFEPTEVYPALDAILEIELGVTGK